MPNQARHHMRARRQRSVIPESRKGRHRRINHTAAAQASETASMKNLMSARAIPLLVVLFFLGCVFPSLPNTSAQEITAPSGPLFLAGGRDQDLPNLIRDPFFALVWIASGLVMWWRLTRTRVWGVVALCAG